MPEVVHIEPLWAILVSLGVLLVGAGVVATVDALVGALVARRSPLEAMLAPTQRLAFMLTQETRPTERPDTLQWILAPAAYAAVAATAFTVVPFDAYLAVADVRAGIVVFGAAEALVIVAIFMHGWSSNSHLSLIGAYRFVALGLSYELLSMFVLIAAALPAESMQVSRIVEAQAGLWNVIKQPLGLPLWIIVTLGVSFWGPLNLSDGGDIVDGTALETSGRQRLVWETARRAMLFVMCAMGAAVFLGGWMGPWLPGWAWMLVKTLALVLVVTWLGHRLGRVTSQRAVTGLWVILLPASFIGLGIAGIEALP